ncbi:putative Acetyltransferase, ribosomal protein N-acetylase [metagenome]|uniref:Putative Acetyltransferase, ribosomal protein N-acetylase n=1 Tax=metagenome TaxID=256318 RepID=A0A2P2C3F6_9ZZZZ
MRCQSVPVDLHTERLTIRDWRRDDAERVLATLGRDDVMRWLGDEPHAVLTDLDQARQSIERWTALSSTPPLGCWAVESTATGEVLGAVLLLVLPHGTEDEVEIGWWLHPDAWGHGYATEAARAVLAHGFTAGLPQILAVTLPGNEPSNRVCRRLGMSEEGVVHRWYDADMLLFRALPPQGRP